ncbi:hypothetical protein NPM06_33875, partial [Bacillus cereus]|uniref:hypothetical protein n=1 Tax=Bacillus cereus TaxID=1396 RepID=UPI0021117456|nr:hypothetical protein [Bacillus cereus]
MQQAVVMVYQNEKEQPQLLEFYKAIANKNRSTRELQAFLSKSFPNFMIPSSIQCVEDFQLTQSGKIDQKALLAVFQ